MNTNTKVVRALEEARTLIDQALFEIRGDSSTAPAKAAISSERSAPTSLSEHVLVLRDRDFFKGPKIAAEVHAGLQPIYRCEMKRVGVELVRLVKRRELRKASKEVGGRKMVAYVW